MMMAFLITFTNHSLRQQRHQNRITFLTHRRPPFSIPSRTTTTTTTTTITITPLMQASDSTPLNEDEDEDEDEDDDNTYRSESMNGSTEEDEQQEQQTTSIPTTVDASVRDVPCSEIKCELYATLACVNRGFIVTSQLRFDIDSLLEQLEKMNPTIAPTKSMSLFSGRWRLLYTDAIDVLLLGLIAPVATVNQIYQNILIPEEEQYDDVDDVDDVDVQNIIEIEPNVSPLLNNILIDNNNDVRTYSNVVVKAKGQVKSDTDLGLIFKSVTIQPQTIFGFQFPSNLLPTPNIPINSPVGQFETTFLDEDIRISRVKIAGRDSVFVFIREP